LNDIAKPFAKRLDNWMRLKGTQELFQAFRDDPSYGGAPPVITSTGGFQGLPSHMRGVVDGGTFAHPDIAILFAGWCDPGFALWTARQIRHLLAYGEVNLYHREWTPEQFQEGVELNRDDIKDLYGE